MKTENTPLTKQEACRIAKILVQHEKDSAAVVNTLHDVMEAYPYDVRWRGITVVLLGLLAKHLAPSAKHTDIETILDLVNVQLRDAIEQHNRKH